MDVKIVQFQPRKVAIYSHIGAPEDLAKSVETFIAWRKETGLSPIMTSDTFGIPHSDPETTDKQQFRFDIAGSITEDIPENRFGVINGRIAGNKCAVLRHYGDLNLINQTVHKLYKEWLPQSNEQLTGEPCFFHYLTVGPEADNATMQTDIYLPIK